MLLSKLCNKISVRFVTIFLIKLLMNGVLHIKTFLGFVKCLLYYY